MNTTLWLFVFVLLVGLIGLVCRRRVRAEFNQPNGLSRLTVAVIWFVYLSHLTITLYASLSGLWELTVPNMLRYTVGGGLTISGLFLMIAGGISFGSLRRVNGKADDQLITTGIYRWSRNPQNVGWILALLGISILGKSGFALLMTGLFIVRFVSYVKEEEKHLETQFGQEYCDYRERTPRYFGLPNPGK